MHLHIGGQCLEKGYQVQGLVFAGHISTKRGHVRAGRDVTGERARPKGSILTGRFRHRAEKFLSGSVIPLRLSAALRSAVDQRGAHRADKHGYFLSRGHSHKWWTQCRQFRELKLRQAPRQNIAQSSARWDWWWIPFPFQAGWYCDAGGIWRDGSKDLLFFDCLSAFLSVCTLSLTSNTFINFSLNQFILFTVKHLKKKPPVRMEMTELCFHCKLCKTRIFGKWIPCVFVFEKCVVVLLTSEKKLQIPNWL